MTMGNGLQEDMEMWVFIGDSIGMGISDATYARQIVQTRRKLCKTLHVNTVVLENVSFAALTYIYIFLFVHLPTNLSHIKYAQLSYTSAVLDFVRQVLERCRFTTIRLEILDDTRYSPWYPIFM